jgi:predicted small lipoprotein YifL
MKAVPIVAAALAVLLVLAGCGRKSTLPENRVPPDDPNPVVEGMELYKLVESEEEAQRIAELYGIELVSVEQEIAVFHTEEDPAEVVRRGEENGWPRLSINRMKQAHS